MKSAHLEGSGCLFPNKLRKAVAHLVRSLVGKGNSANRRWFELVLYNKSSDPRYEDLKQDQDGSKSFVGIAQVTLVFPLPGPANICKGIEGSWVTATCCMRYIDLFINEIRYLDAVRC